MNCPVRGAAGQVGGVTQGEVLDFPTGSSGAEDRVSPVLQGPWLLCCTVCRAVIGL